jgi:hypothetical protein
MGEGGGGEMLRSLNNPEEPMVANKIDLHGSTREYAPTICALSFAIAAALTPPSAAAVGRLGNLDIVSRSDGQVLPVYPSAGRNWVVGTPGQEYSIRFCNTTSGRVLAVMSVDGINVITGDTASPAQSGYVLNGHECADISGWRKSMTRTAAFYFTELPDAYATRTGRPENVGVIGVAVFRERRPIAWREPLPKIAGRSKQDAQQPNASPTPSAEPYAQDRRENADSVSRAAEAAGVTEALASRAPQGKLGTGHGRGEDSPTQVVRFDRESAAPNETISIYYDRRENLAAMGILPSPQYGRATDPNPFPALTRFVPDPPNR